MRNFLTTMTTVAALGLSTVACAQENAADWRDHINLDQLSPAELHAQLIHNDEINGFMRLGWNKDQDGDFIIYDRSQLTSAELYETMQTKLDGETFAVESASVRMHQGAAIIYFDVNVAGDKLTAKRKIHRPGQEDASQEKVMDLPDGATTRGMMILLAPAIDLEEGESFDVVWYSALSETIETVTVVREGTTSVETPAGTFETDLIRYKTNGSPENIFYIAEDENGKRRTVRIDIPDLNMYFQLLP